MGFSDCLKELRQDKKCTQRQLAEYLGYSKNIICEWENKRSEPNIETLLKLSNYFEVSIDYLLGRADELDNVTVQSSAPALPADELELLRLFRQMNQKQKNRVIGFSEGLLGTSSQSKNMA